MKPIKLEKINNILEKVGILLIVHSWEGKGEWEPTKFEFMTVKEFEIRCERRRYNEMHKKDI